jgi:hypothetical protein
MPASRIKVDSRAKDILDDSVEISIKNLCVLVSNDIPCLPFWEWITASGRYGGP